MTKDTIRAEIYVPGKGDEAHENRSCRLLTFQADRRCPLVGCSCDYGLTEIEVPKVCPLRLGTVVIKVSRIVEKVPEQ